MNATREQVKATLDTVRALADAIRDLGSVPSVKLYAMVMGHMDLALYERIVAVLKNAGLVSESGHVLTWTGPKFATPPSRNRDGYEGMQFNLNNTPDAVSKEAS